MRRRALTAVLALAFALALLPAVACGTGGEADGSASRSAEASPSTPSSASSSAPAGDGPVIVVDPGHNGANGVHPDEIGRPVDAGGFQKPCNTTGTATADGTTESSINWAVAQLVRDRLEAAGARVVLTRTDDAGVGPCVDERGRMAAAAGADALVSIHADGAPPTARGFHVIHPGHRPGYTDDTVGPSAELAATVRDALVGAGFAPAGYVGGGGLVQRDDLGTLNWAGVPAVMVEAGNLANAEDAAALTSPDGQDRLAGALADAALAFARS
ncbi:MAG TPA: N-acetylmuramoyl-L-alanine amidase [Acidimicrobiales bacterium]